MARKNSSCLLHNRPDRLAPSYALCLAGGTDYPRWRINLVGSHSLFPLGEDLTSRTSLNIGDVPFGQGVVDSACGSESKVE